MNTAIESVKALIKHLDVKVTNTTITNKLMTSPYYPELSFSDINEALKSWGIDCLIGKSDINTLYEVEFPLLVLINENDHEGNINSFVILLEINKENVIYFDPIRGQVQNSLNEFLKKWQGVFLLPAVDENSGEQDYDKLKAEEDELEQKNIELKQNYIKQIKLIDNFLTNDECDYLINYSLPFYSRSKIVNSDNDDISSSVRTSFSAFLNDKTDNFFNIIYNRASQLLNVPLENFESIQCVRYSPLQEFKAHYDAQEKLERSFTILVYLNNDFDGGETFFPLLDIKIKPKKGKAVVFTNLTKEGEVDKFSLHAGLPVLKGIKYACNIWVHKHKIQ